MRIHLISIGGAAMHNVGLALQANGHEVTGSDDEVYEPSRSRLEKAGLLPGRMGWNPDRITTDIEVIILGMHAKVDNPELLRAQDLDLKIYSYPSYVHEHAKDKKRVVIAGSHGKTTTTSMIMHVLREEGVDFDYLVGAQLEGFDRMVRFSDAPVMIIEGDEYLSSPIDRRPKMLHYRPHVAVITGIAWDHINVFPTFENYVEQFSLLVDSMELDSELFYYDQKEILEIVQDSSKEVKKEIYKGLDQAIDGVVHYNGAQYPLHIFGKHNMQNLEAAMKVCFSLGVEEGAFFRHMKSFKGAAKRLQLLAYSEENNARLYLDFAHAPSKVKATTAAMKAKYPEQKLLAVLELHTFSSLDPVFILHYRGAMDAADEAAVFFNEHTLKMKGRGNIDTDFVMDAFDCRGLQVFNNRVEMEQWLQREDYRDTNILLMTSGNFDSLDLTHWSEKIGNIKKS